MRCAEVVTDFMRGHQAVECCTSVAFAEARTEEITAQGAAPCDTNGRTIQVAPCVKVRQAIAVLRWRIFDS